jgi:hypothetical protein
MAPLNFFDCNTFIGRSRKPSPLAFDTVEGLLAELDYLGIDEAAVFHMAGVSAWDEGNAELMAGIQGHERLHGCWTYPLHHYPDMPEPLKVVENMLAQGVKIARLFPTYYFTQEVSDWACGKLFSALESHRVPVFLTNSELGRFPDETRPSYSPKNIYDICQRHPQLPLVIMQLNFSATRILYPLMEQCPNLHVEISYYTTHRGVEFLVRDFGPERVLFGTGMPSNGPGVALGLVRYADITDEARALVAGGNTRRLMQEVG